MQTRDSIKIHAEMRKEYPGEYIQDEMDFCPLVHHLYSAMYDNRGFERIYVLSKRVMDKIDHSDSYPIYSSEEGLSLLFKEDDFGYIIAPYRQKNEKGEYVIAKDQSYNINCAYYIKDGKFYMQLWTAGAKAGYIIYDKEGFDNIMFIPYTSLSMYGIGQFPKDKQIVEFAQQEYERIKADFPDGNIPEPYTVVGKKKILKKKCGQIFQNHNDLLSRLVWMFNAIVFIRLSDVYTKEFVPDPTPTYRRKKGYVPLSYTMVNATWDMNIDVNTPFPVRGHYKMQAIKNNGEWDHKLIYIEKYMKSGYHRKAQKRIEYGEL